MITKERLEELIEQGATIWNDEWEEIKLNKETCEICEMKSITGKHISWCLYFEYEHNNQKCCYDICIEDLEENVENGRERLEFGNITRTERLELPSWEEIKEKDDCFFNSKDYKICLSINIEGNRIKIFQCVFGGGNFIIFDKPITRENYNEARRLCVKLFRGEKV